MGREREPKQNKKGLVHCHSSLGKCLFRNWCSQNLQMRRPLCKRGKKKGDFKPRKRKESAIREQRAVNHQK